MAVGVSLYAAAPGGLLGVAAINTMIGAGATSSGWVHSWGLRLGLGLAIIWGTALGLALSAIGGSPVPKRACRANHHPWG